MAKPTQNTIAQAEDRIRLWWEKPHVFVREVFGVTPDPWQDKVLEAFPHKPRIAMQASKGPGKTSTLAWLAWNYLVTRPEPKIPATSVNWDNLQDNLWSEMAKWQGQMRFGLADKFQYTKSKIFLKERPDTWFMTARSWSKSASEEQLAATLAGTHADYTLYVLDESGSIPRAVMNAAEGALAAGIEGHIVQAGNCVSLESPLYDAATKHAALWFMVEINGDPDNPLRSSRIPIEWAREQIQMHGRDDPFVLVNVLGRWPPASLSGLIGPDEIDAAMKRGYPESMVFGFPKILAIDTAAFGDDANVITKRQGPLILPQRELRHIEGDQLAAIVSNEWVTWGADACLMDDTGGYGGALGTGLKLLSRTPFKVTFSGKPRDPRYLNTRMEIYWLFAQWLKEGGALPPEAKEIKAAMCATQYTYSGDKMVLEPKASVKKKLGYSPDHCDSAALTFAVDVGIARSAFENSIGGQNRSYTAEYDPSRECWNPNGCHGDDYSPAGGRGVPKHWIPFRPPGSY
jgi:phage terminase large subunit